MALSYLVTTVAVVLFAQFVLTRFVLTRPTAASDLTARVLDSAQTIAKKYTTTSADGGTVSLGSPDAPAGDGKTHLRGGTVVVPMIAGADVGQVVTAAIVFNEQLRVEASSFPARYPTGDSPMSRLPEDASNTVKKSFQPPPRSEPPALSALSTRGTERVAWAFVGVPAGVKGAGSVEHYVYLESPASVDRQTVHIGAVAAIVGLALPVGLLFGWLATRGPRLRLRALTTASNALAEGNFATRLTPGSTDELGQLEARFNEMAERLEAATERERELAIRNATLAERGRISREMHDALSQELFSLNLLVGGLREALPAASPLQAQVASLQVSTTRAIDELRALLLDLRPTVLAELGVSAALEDLCESYRVRFGLNIDAHVEAASLDTARGHAVVRIAQEGLTNAMKHADAERIELNFVTADGYAEISVADNGRGYQRDAASNGLGLRLMHERVHELNGELDIDSAPGHGTLVRARFALSSEATR
jgi:signal transduction histidine kinase